jgi:hypothetical protein
MTGNRVAAIYIVATTPMLKLRKWSLKRDVLNDLPSHLLVSAHHQQVIAVDCTGSSRFRVCISDLQLATRVSYIIARRYRGRLVLVTKLEVGVLHEAGNILGDSFTAVSSRLAGNKYESVDGIVALPTLWAIVYTGRGPCPQ